MNNNPNVKNDLNKLNQFDIIEVNNVFELRNLVASWNDPMVRLFKLKKVVQFSFANYLYLADNNFEKRASFEVLIESINIINQLNIHLKREQIKISKERFLNILTDSETTIEQILEISDELFEIISYYEKPSKNLAGGAVGYFFGGLIGAAIGAGISQISRSKQNKRVDEACRETCNYANGKIIVLQKVFNQLDYLMNFEITKFTKTILNNIIEIAINNEIKPYTSGRIKLFKI